MFSEQQIEIITRALPKIIEQNEKIIKILEAQYHIFSQYDISYHEELERSGDIGIPK